MTSAPEEFNTLFSFTNDNKPGAKPIEETALPKAFRKTDNV
jgi:hypothetical protein